MRIIDHSPDQITSYIVHQDKIRTTVSYDTLASYFRAMQQSTLLHDHERVHCLLDERLFAYHRFAVQLTSKTPYTIGALKQLIQTKIAAAKGGSQYNAYILHRLVDMSVDGESSSHVLGQTGNLSFVLEVCVMQPEGVTLCELLGGSSIFTHPHISFCPRNYYTLTRLRDQYQRPYALLFIEQQTSQLIIVKDSRYEEVTYINIGLNLLKDCYKEHDVEKYFYTSRDEVVNNPFLTKVIDQAVSFFTNMLAKRAQQYVPAQQPIIVAGDIIGNPSFLPLFKDSYSAFGSSYIVPLSPMQSPNVSYTFLPKEIAVASCLHYTLD